MGQLSGGGRWPGEEPPLQQPARSRHVHFVFVKMSGKYKTLARGIRAIILRLESRSSNAISSDILPLISTPSLFLPSSIVCDTVCMHPCIRIFIILSLCGSPTHLSLSCGSTYHSTSIVLHSFATTMPPHPPHRTLWKKTTTR